MLFEDCVVYLVECDKFVLDDLTELYTGLRQILKSVEKSQMLRKVSNFYASLRKVSNFYTSLRKVCSFNGFLTYIAKG